MSETIDLSAQAWGRNYNVLNVEDDGQKLRLATWSTPTPKDGDFLILRNGPNETTRYRADVVKYCGNPRDMCIVNATFAPRPHNQGQHNAES